MDEDRTIFRIIMLNLKTLKQKQMFENIIMHTGWTCRLQEWKQKAEVNGYSIEILCEILTRYYLGKPPHEPIFH